MEKANGRPIFETPLAGELRALGAAITPRGIRVTGKAPLRTQPSVAPAPPSPQPAAEPTPWDRTEPWDTSGVEDSWARGRTPQSNTADLPKPWQSGPRRGRTLSDAMEELSFDDDSDSPPEPPRGPGFRPRRGYRR